MADAVYAVVDKSKKRSLPEKDAAESKAAQSFDSPVYDLAETDVSTVPVSGKNEEFESVYSMVSLDNNIMYSTLNQNTPPRATAQVPNQRLSQPTNWIAEKTPEKERSWNEGTSCKIFACIFITIAVVALILLICIAVLFAEVNKLKQTASPQQSPLGQLAPNDLNIMSELQKINKSLTDFVQSETISEKLNHSIIELLDTRLNTSMDRVYQQLDQVYYTLDNNTQQLNSSIEMLKSVNNSAFETVLLQLGQDISSLENKTNTLIQYLGQSRELPASSCAALIGLSGDYWVRASNGSAVRVYCDMTRSCGGVTGGWVRVAELDMTDSSQQCPDGLTLHNDSNIRTCGSTSSVTCSSVTFSAPFEYSRVCGKIIGYQRGSPDTFHLNSQPATIDGNYLDGISLTHGSDQRQHIWTFAAGVDETMRQANCPCTNTDFAGATSQPPEFVGNDYFCDTGAELVVNGYFFGEDPLWDGAGCGPLNTCCTFNDPPWFYKQLPEPTTDGIEMRVCRNQPRIDEDVEIETIDIFVQ